MDLVSWNVTLIGAEVGPDPTTADSLRVQYDFEGTRCVLTHPNHQVFVGDKYDVVSIDFGK